MGRVFLKNALYGETLPNGPNPYLVTGLRVFTKINVDILITVLFFSME